MTLRKIRNYLFGTLRGRLILSVAIVHAVMMTLFVLDLTVRQRSMLLDRQEEEATALAQSLSTSAAVWIASDDVSGLQELVELQRRYPEFIFAILTDEDGRILAHSDKSRTGRFLLDLPGEVRQTVIGKTPLLTDVAVPAFLAARHVGWARVGIGQKAAQDKLAEIAFNGALYAVAAIVIGSLIAWLLGRRITGRLYAIQDTINMIRTGNRSARSKITGTDEAASIATEFNAMLNVLDERDAALTRSEAKYRLLLRNIRAAVIVHGPDTRILMSNPMAQELLGLSEQLLLGKTAVDPAWRFLRDDGSTMPLEEYPINRTLAERRPLQNLIIGVRRTDRDAPTWILANTEPILNEQGEIGEIIVTFVDVTARKLAEAALRKSEGLYTSFVAASPDGVGVIDERGKVIFASRKMYELLNIGLEKDLVGMNAIEWLMPADRQRAARDLAAIANGSVALDETYTLARSDGTTLPVEISGAPILGDDKHLDGIVTIVRDASARRLAEAALRTSQETLRKRDVELNEAQRLAHIGSWDWDAVNDSIWWSDEYFSIYGHDPSKPTPNYIEHLKAYTPESAGRLDFAVKRAMETGQPYELDLELERPTASTRWIVARGEVKRDANGAIWGLRGTAQNITERKDAEEKIKALNEELEKRVADRTEDLQKTSRELKDSQSALMNIVEDLNEKTTELERANARLMEFDQLKSMFIASMSHELRTPLNSIIGFSSILLNEWTGPMSVEQKENLAAILRSGRHLLSLINDVIDVSKIEAGKIEPMVEDFDVHELVGEAIETQKKDIERKELSLKVRAPRRILHADRRRLFQCLLNLISNAVKYTQRGTIEVNVEPSADGSMLIVAVEDTGIGIGVDDLDRLFLPFVRLKTPLENTVPGTGLGLYLTKKLVREILKGEISVTSSYGEGSRFEIRLPVAG